MRIIPALACVALAVTLTSPADAQPRANVAVFNSQMKSDTPDWLWLEKGLADRIITDLFRDSTVTVVDRDAMQQVADQMKWAPEMMSDPKRLDMIRMSLRPRYLISGVYQIAGDRLSMTAIIVDVNTSGEVARREVSGASGEALELARKLSTEVLAWFTKRPAEKILPELPVWTRSIPAARALYEGVDLYDQGRYGEGWLKFRRASHEDAEYLEARYWTGKMYYFMDRYEHARLSLEEFLYRNPEHPRTGDAVMEFLHTYEKLDTPPEALLTLYLDLEQRFDMTFFRAGYPDLKGWRYSAAPSRITPHGAATLVGQVLRAKRVRLLEALGRFDEALRLMAVDHPGGKEGVGRGRVAAASPRGLAHYVRLGYTFSPEELRAYFILPPSTEIVRFDKRRREASVSAGGGTKRMADEWFLGERPATILLAPTGQVFRNLTVFPETGAGNEGRLVLRLSGPQNLDVNAETPGDIRQGRTQGIRVTAMPRTNWLNLSVSYRARKPLEGLRVVPELEPIGPHGTLDVTCPNTATFTVTIDGNPAACGPGLIGLVAPGRHQVELHGRAGDCYQPWRTTVEVVEGKTTLVAGQLPWRKDGPFAGWNPGMLVGWDYPVTATGGSDASPPTIFADEDAIRLVWAHGADLWSAVSVDGKAFSRPSRLELPVSSAWDENEPRLARDELDRFVLLFRCNRDIQHRRLPYVCWSRDFQHWSAPAMLGRDPILSNVLTLDGGGRPITLRDSPLSWQLALCRDLHVWGPRHSDKGPYVHPRLACKTTLLREDGRYELYALISEFIPDSSHRHARLWQYVSDDGRRWSEPSELAEMVATGRRFGICAVRAQGASLVALFEETADPPRRTGMKLFRQTAEGAWEQSPWFDDIGHPLADLAWHPRWGYTIAWDGPYVANGDQVDTLLRAKPQPGVLEREARERYDLGRSWQLQSDAPKAAAQYRKVLALPDVPDVTQAARRELEALQ